MQANSGHINDRFGWQVREIRSISSLSFALSFMFRMLLITKSHHEPDEAMLPDRENTRRMSLCKESVNPWTGASQFLPTTNRIIQFSNGREPKVRSCFFF